MLNDFRRHSDAGLPLANPITGSREPSEGPDEIQPVHSMPFVAQAVRPVVIVVFLN